MREFSREARPGLVVENERGRCRRFAAGACMLVRTKGRATSLPVDTASYLLPQPSCWELPDASLLHFGNLVAPVFLVANSGGLGATANTVRHGIRESKNDPARPVRRQLEYPGLRESHIAFLVSLERREGWGKRPS